MIIDISFKKEYTVQEMIDKTVCFCRLDYKPKKNHYICTGTMLFSIWPSGIHICSILETETEVQFIKKYIGNLFSNKIIAISCIGYMDMFRNIPNVEVIDITPQFPPNHTLLESRQ